MEKSATEILCEAEQAGKTALEHCKPTPMIVQEVGLDDKPYPGSQKYFVEDGVCGFAWIWIPDSRCEFIKAMKRLGLAEPKETYCYTPGDKRYPFEKCIYKKGYDFWVREGNQSYEKKMAFAEAFAAVLEKYGITAYAQGRLD